jgi:hypothetical protein
MMKAPITTFRSSYNNMKIDIDIREEKYWKKQLLA